MRKNYSTDGFSNLTWGTFLRETISDRISHFLVKSIQKQLDKLNKNKSEDVQLENKNEPEFQYPTNLTPFYLHWKCSISENANTRTVEQEGIPWQIKSLTINFDIYKLSYIGLPLRPGRVFSSVLYCGLSVYRWPRKT